ncbi:Exodeoxyribonuclease VII large subunit [Pseudonocardia sp. Ae168_Ps1]|uniref:exodeoxyribonuclease VII large subunit n=1 Tax=unclassified Pseudonocardia TaxID=2619320 RepID=UPI00094B6422|nr:MULTISPECIES: exodeoxyribonuclease VII large subunit [unclassified Pseudonocardia]OLL75712.1 Exodeoxyribonuclease VII large subunit [Pseudonocardia sp. Ae150A_Ps1]OLL81712.1 Exodeoxyribonuclease VII large subunit [Pseudonocardia sp. Ae168_Ps1]OLL84176.1 Exodeoxyribonuclease VII large subunit [Pseudonocardia sp. Ae263_Ps1]OLL95806.1 Exodeoxyribonuclease VII large subunit [Pseudonocardia sp. Ae356_Ps1]
MTTSEEDPWPVRTVARKIAEWVDRLGAVWVEGQLAQVNARTGTAFLTLRDPAADVSLQLTAPSSLVRDSGGAVTEGSRVIVHGKPSFYLGRGTLSLRVDRIRAVGLGELLARIERLRRLLDAEGLFDPALKRRPPLLPHTIGLVTGRDSAAEHDVVSGATARWPAVRFRIENVAVQGGLAVEQVVGALRTLDRDPDVQVIVLARGGGSVEDLLPFSDETLCRAVAACRTPVVSAIGHEPDTPLVDHVADVRCSTPTAAGRSLVPDLGEETARIAGLRDRARHALHGWVDREQRRLDDLRRRPALAEPLRLVGSREREIADARAAAHRAVLRRLDRSSSELEHLTARLTALGPTATLARGYAIVQLTGSGDDVPPLLRSAADAPAGTELRIRVADGAVAATVTGPDDDSRRASGTTTTSGTAKETG